MIQILFKIYFLQILYLKITENKTNPPTYPQKKNVPICTVPLGQGSSNLSLEGQSAAEFSSNPDQTHLSVIF